jgi:hypothetical protein
MIKNSNVQLTSNVYPVRAEGEYIDFTENVAFVRRVWERKALIKLFQFVFHAPLDTRLLSNYISELSGLSQWQIRRLKTPDECLIALPDEKPWGVVIRGDVFEEVCKCNRHDCSGFNKCRPDMENL